MRIARILLCLCCTASAAEEQWTVSAGGMDVPFKAWHADGARAGMGLLVLVPGYNGDGGEMLDQRWKAFAEKKGMLLLAPTFKAEGHENNGGRGYYYPEQGSGKVMEAAIAAAGNEDGMTAYWEDVA